MTTRCLLMIVSFVVFSVSMAVEGRPVWDGVGLVDIWNNVGEPITVHCKDLFTDLMPQRIGHGENYIIRVQPNREETTVYTCSFLWGLNRSQELAVWAGTSHHNPPSICGAVGSRKCLYEVSQQGILVANSSMSVGQPEGGSTWQLFREWRHTAMSPDAS
jgi:hypothetical protein